MPLEILDAVLSDFDRVFEGFDSAQRAQPALKFLLFLADKDPSTKLSWCPVHLDDILVMGVKSQFVSSGTTTWLSDHFGVLSAINKDFYLVHQDLYDTYDCNVAEPVIYKKLEASSSNVVLLRAYVGDRPTWRNPSHPWRVDPRFKVKGVPTLIRWENGGVTKRLEDYEAHVEEKIESLLATK